MLQALEKSVLVEAGRDRIEDLNPYRAGIALERSAPPIEPGIERDGHARHAGFGIEVGDAGFVCRRSAGLSSRPFGKDDDLTSAPQLLPRSSGHGGECLAACPAVDRHHAALPHEPAE